MSRCDGPCSASDVHPNPKYVRGQECMSIDENVKTINIGYSVCDAAGFDNQY